MTCAHFQCVDKGTYLPLIPQWKQHQACPWCEVERLQSQLKAALEIAEYWRRWANRNQASQVSDGHLLMEPSAGGALPNTPATYSTLSAPVETSASQSDEPFRHTEWCNVGRVNTEGLWMACNCGLAERVKR